MFIKLKVLQLSMTCLFYNKQHFKHDEGFRLCFNSESTPLNNNIRNMMIKLGDNNCAPLKTKILNNILNMIKNKPDYNEKPLFFINSTIINNILYMMEIKSYTSNRAS